MTSRILIVATFLVPLLSGCLTTNSNTQSLQTVTFAPVDSQNLAKLPSVGLIEIRKISISAPKSGEMIGGFTVVTQQLRSVWGSTARNVGQSSHTIGYQLKDDIGVSTSGVFDRYFRTSSASNLTASIILRPSISNTLGRNVFTQYTYHRVLFEIVVAIDENGQTLFKRFYKGAADQKTYYSDLSGEACSTLLRQAFQEALDNFQADFPRDLKKSLDGLGRTT